MATPNGTQLQIATDSGFVTKQVDYSGDYVTNYGIGMNVLPRNTQLYARIRHSTVEAGYTPWSATRMFTIAQYNKWVGYSNSNTNNGVFARVIVSPDSDYLYAVGNRFESGVDSYSCGYICKFDNTGTPIWCKKIEHRNIFRSLTLSDDGNYLYAGGLDYINNGLSYQNLSMIKINTTTGNIIWQKTIVNTLRVNSYNAPYGCRYYNNAIYVGGYMSDATAAPRAFMMKIDTDGNILWHRGSPNNGGQFANMTIAPDGSALYGVGLYFVSSSNYYGYIVKMDLSGNVIWQRQVITDLVTYNLIRFFGVAVSADSNYISVVGIKHIDASTYRPFVIKLDKDGNKIWEHVLNYRDNEDQDILGISFGYNGTAFDSAGNIFCAGDFSTNAANNYGSPTIVKFNADGTVLWNKQLVVSNNRDGAVNAITYFSDGNLYASGSLTIVQRSCFLAAVDASGPVVGALPDLPDLAWYDINIRFDTPSDTVTTYSGSFIVHDTDYIFTDTNYTVTDVTEAFYKSAY